MPGKFTAGQLQKMLKEKVFGESVQEDEGPFAIKKTDPSTFADIPAAYHKKDRQLHENLASKPLFHEQSPIKKPIHARMKEFVKNQYAPK